jgi:hypothetical protein
MEDASLAGLHRLRKAAAVLTEVRQKFDEVRSLRRTNNAASLKAAGAVVVAGLELLERATERRGIEWRGAGDKTYDVFAIPNSDSEFSRGVRRSLFVGDPADFASRWDTLLSALSSSEGSEVLQGVTGDEVDRLYYTAVISFGAVVDLFGSGDRGGPGTFFECLIGPSVAILTGRRERSYIDVPFPGTANETARVPTDLSFQKEEDGQAAIVIPVKISTRERISQAYVHQAILDKDTRFVFRSVLCVANENNMVGGRSLRSASLKDTLVPNTIIQYQGFIAKLTGIYYLDPPDSYFPPPRLFPRVAQFHELLTADLAALGTV